MFQDLGYKYLVQGCNNGDFAKSCYLAGSFHKTKLNHNFKTEQSLTEATKLFGRACELGHADGCHHEGSAYLRGVPNVEVRLILIKNMITALPFK